MTRHETFEMNHISRKDLVLATDLDGTFLGGSDAARSKFYAWLEANRDRIGLIFVTGRDPGHISYLTRKQGVPRPDYAVADVGTTIAAVDGDHYLRPIEALEAEIATSWNNANGIVEARLSRVRGLKLQSSGFRHRVSYDMDPENFDTRALDIVAELGHDALISDNRYFDVLPKGVSKGPSLLRLLAHLGVENEKTLVAGDTMNDYSMLSMGLRSVAVGGSEPALLEKLADLEHVHKAKEPGVVGIAEAIMAFGMLKSA